MRLTVVGLGKVGRELARYLVHLGHHVTGFDIVQTFDAGTGFTATMSPAVAYENAEAAVLIVPTPQVGDRLSSECIRKAGEEARRLMPMGAHLLIASTLDPRDAADVCRTIGAVYTPIFVRLGSVFKDLQNQQFLLIGFACGAVFTSESHVLEVWKWFRDGKPDRPVIVSGATTIACAKLAINATLSSRIAWANDVAVRAKAFGADPDVVCKIIGMDPRIGPAFGNPGFPPGGPCLPRDLDVWLSASGQGMAEAVLVSHRITRQRILAQIMEELKSRPIKSVLVVGLTYKPGGFDHTDALGLEVVRECAKAGYQVCAYDREGTPAELIAHAGGQLVEATATFSAFDAIIVGFPGYPEECAEAARHMSPGITIINPWK